MSYYLGASEFCAHDNLVSIVAIDGLFHSVCVRLRLHVINHWKISFHFVCFLLKLILLPFIPLHEIMYVIRLITGVCNACLFDNFRENTLLSAIRHNFQTTYLFVLTV